MFFAGAKVLRQIRLDNSHQPPLAATLQTNAVRDYAFVNERVHECIELSIFPLLEALKFQVFRMSNRQGTKLSTVECISDLMARYSLDQSSHGKATFRTAISYFLMGEKLLLGW